MDPLHFPNIETEGSFRTTGPNKPEPGENQKGLVLLGRTFRSTGHFIFLLLDLVAPPVRTTGSILIKLLGLMGIGLERCRTIIY